MIVFKEICYKINLKKKVFFGFFLGFFGFFLVLCVSERILLLVLLLLLDLELLRADFARESFVEAYLSEQVGDLCGDREIRIVVDDDTVVDDDAVGEFGDPHHQPDHSDFVCSMHALF
tara:strand:- start:170 stop:523 length:354 start_codon:yes stop_codon:yes gene_type:complete